MDDGDDVCPYQGLAPFETGRSALFFGRTRATRGLLERLTPRLEGRGLTMSPRWLRSFRVIKKAERKNQRRFERQLAREARLVSEGGTNWVHDHWDARINAFIGTELFYVSRMSMLRSQARSY